MRKPTILASTRKRLVSEATEFFKRMQAHPDIARVPESKACLFWAQAAILAGNRMGGLWKELQLQGGSASWRVVRPQDDDGVSATHYSYQWQEGTPLLVETEDDTVTLAEVHFWAAAAPVKGVHPGVIVDVTTRFVPELLRETSIRATTYPPNAIISFADELTDCIYEPTVSATVAGSALVNRLLTIRNGRFTSFKELNEGAV